jgi:hypothetical protein
MGRGAYLCVQRTVLAGLLPSVGKSHHVFGRALDDEIALPVAFGEYRDASPFEIERYLVDLAPSRQLTGVRFQDGIVQGALESRLKSRIDISPSQDFATFVSLDIDPSNELDPRLGKGAGLITAENVHATQVMHRR